MPYSPKEELANSLTHGLGAALSIIGLVLLLVNADTQEDTWRIVSFSIFGSSLFLLYLASTLYHSFRSEALKKIFKTLDHCAIYLLIAGSYTPFLLVKLREGPGWTLFVVVWLIALAGIILKLLFQHRFKALRVATYLVMGWLVVMASNSLMSNIEAGGLWLLLAGGLAYTVGVVFYLGHKIPYNHAIWHLFVLGGSICHYFAVYFYVMPMA
ncbi:MAG: hemolysin III family protein [Hahellaceae bacterium]|nr:hemolysin III family protein [Hahellaceae bacterium]MCP5169390.1 hemolysin III family protein [Hahellaceae bacterium]